MGEVERLPVAVIGVGGVGSLTLQGMLRSEAVKVVGIADRNGRVAEQAGKAAGVPAYGDNRSLLAETRPRAVFLAVPPADAPDLLAACAERGIHVWTESPAARNLAEAVAMVRRMEEANLKLAVGTQRRFAAGYRRAWELRNRVGQMFLARMRYLFNWGQELGWRGDRSSAGGGALLELGYHAVDMLVWTLGLPEEVYGCVAGGSRPGPRVQGEQACPVYDTDDTAAAIFRCRNGCIATVVTTRRSGPVNEEMAMHGRDGSIVASGDSCLLRDADGNVLDRISDPSAGAEMFRRQAEAFATAVLEDRPKWECSGRENLMNLAVIEAIYLSDRTRQPEVPLRLLKTNGYTVEECLAVRPE